MAGFPYTIPGRADFKKEYDFIWKLQLSEGFENIGASEDYTAFKGFSSRYKNADGKWTSNIEEAVDITNPDMRAGGIDLAKEKRRIFDSQFVNYVCQLCEKVDIPDDEFETEDIEYGPTTIKMPKRVILHDITVTYLEDSLNSVYNFHKSWFNAIRCKGGINSPYTFTAMATYMTYDRTLSQWLQGGFRNRIEKDVNGFLSALSTSNMGASAVTAAFGIENDLLQKITGSHRYPFIYPIKIDPSDADKSGTEISRTTVTYTRLPNIIIPKTTNSVKEATDSLGEITE